MSKSHTLRDDGVWTWFTQPRAVRHVGTNDKTYTGAVNSNGDIVAASFDHDTGAVETSTLHTSYEEDDHTSPTLLVRNSDARIIVFYSEHSVSNFKYRISENPEDITSWQAEQSISTPNQNTYGYVVQLSGESDRIYNFYRSYPDIAAVWSDDGGETWSSEKQFIAPASRTSYITVGTNGVDRIDFAVSSNVDTSIEQNLQHCYYQNGDVHTSGGTVIGSLSDAEPIINESETTMIYDSSVTGYDAWTCDCATTGGNPQIVYTRYSSDISQHFYRYAKWDGQQWNDGHLLDAGSTPKADSTWVHSNGDHYMNGVILDDFQDGVVYASVGDHETSNLYRLESDDGGETWTQEQLTSRTDQNIRPVVPVNMTDGASSEMPVVWLSGQYDDYKPGSEYATSVLGGLGGPEQSLATSGTLATDKRSADDGLEWETAEDWNSARENQSVSVVNDGVELSLE